MMEGKRDCAVDVSTLGDTLVQCHFKVSELYS